jgi:hypothetical protein
MIAHSRLPEVEQQKTPQTGSLASWEEWFKNTEAFSGSKKTGRDCYFQARNLKPKMAQKLGLTLESMSRVASARNAGAAGGAVQKRKFDELREVEARLKLDPKNEELLAGLAATRAKLADDLFLQIKLAWDELREVEARLKLDPHNEELLARLAATRAKLPDSIALQTKDDWDELHEEKKSSQT